MARTKFTPEPKKNPEEDRSLEAWAGVIMKKKSGRTAPVKKTINSRYRNLGGFMIDPLETCLKQVESEDGAFWTDLGLCRHCKAPCQRYLSFKKMSPEERNEDNLIRGIIPPRKWGMEE